MLFQPISQSFSSKTSLQSINAHIHLPINITFHLLRKFQHLKIVINNPSLHHTQKWLNTTSSLFHIFTHTFHKVTPTTYYTHIFVIMGMVWHVEILFKHLRHQMDTLSHPSFHPNFSSVTCNYEAFNPCLLLL